MTTGSINETIRELSERYPNKIFLTLEEVAALVECTPRTVYNWTKRADASKRPPRISIGKSLRFPKNEFLRWLFTNEMA
jgi:predicted DNA-binding transcriptional regulator AlpA